MQCSETLEKIRVTLNLAAIGHIPVPANSPQKPERLRGKIGPHFSPQGYMEYNHFYYKPKEFCLSRWVANMQIILQSFNFFQTPRISNEDIEVEICPINCATSGHLCLPKCCGAGEVMLYWNWTCIQTPDHWTPFLYEDVYTRLPSEEENSLEIHYTRPFLKCVGPPVGPNNSTQWNWFSWSFSEVKRPRKVDPKKKPPDPGLVYDAKIAEIFGKLALHWVMITYLDSAF